MNSNFSPDTTLLIAYLKRCHEEDKVAEYRDMEEIVPRVAKEKRHCLESALRYLKKEYGYLFRCIVSVGYRPLKNEEKASSVTSYREQRVRSQVYRWNDELATIQTTALKQPDYNTYLTSCIKLSAHKMLLSSEFSDRAQTAVKNTTKQSVVNYSREAIKALIDVS